MKIKYISDDSALDDIATSAGLRILLQFGRQVQRIARRLTKPAKGPAPANQPPHEHFGDLDRSIGVGVTEAGEVVAGSRSSIVGERGHVLEFAGTFEKTAGRDVAGRFLRGHASRKAPSGAKWAHPFMRLAFEEAVAAGSFEPAENVSSSFT